MNRFFLFLINAFIMSLFLNTAQANTVAPAYCHYYPHWDDCATSSDLKKIEAFIAQYGGNAHRYIAAFDWDGTLYDEHIALKKTKGHLTASGQSLWHLWAAEMLMTHPNGEYNALLPAFKAFKPNGATIDYTAWHDNIVNMDNYLEGRYHTLTETEKKNSVVKTRALPNSIYDKFSQIASFETGMTFNELQNSLHAFLNDYPAKDYAFAKLFDLMHRLEVAGFRIWIITGSNPFYIADVLTDRENGVNQLYDTNVLPACQTLLNQYRKDSTGLTPEAFFKACTIAGNANEWPGGKAPFTRHYDDRNFSTAENDIKMTVDHYGKWLAAQHLSKREKAPIVFYAGNSDGDYNLMKRILSNAFSSSLKTFGVFVQPNQHGGRALKSLLDTSCKKDQCIEVKQPR